MAVHNLAAFTSSSAWLPPGASLLSCHNNDGEDQSDNNDNQQDVANNVQADDEDQQ